MWRWIWRHGQAVIGLWGFDKLLRKMYSNGNRFIKVEKDERQSWSLLLSQYLHWKYQKRQGLNRNTKLTHLIYLAMVTMSSDRDYLTTIKWEY